MWMNSQIHPADEAADLQRPGGDDRAAAGDVGRRAEVMVAERLLVDLPRDLVPDAVRGVEPGLHRHLGDAGELVQAHHVAEDGNLRMAGDGQVLLDEDAPGPVALGAGGGREGRGDGRGLDPGGPQHGAGVVAGLAAPAWSRTSSPSSSTWVTSEPMCSSTPRRRRVRAAFCDSFGPNMASGALPPSKSSTRASSGLMFRNSARSVLVATSRIWPASSTPVGPAPTRAKVSQRAAFRRVGGGVRHLERAVDPAPDRERVGDRLHARCPVGELVMAEVGLPHSGGDDEVVVAELDAARRRAAWQ